MGYIQTPKSITIISNNNVGKNKMAWRSVLDYYELVYHVWHAIMYFPQINIPYMLSKN